MSEDNCLSLRENTIIARGSGVFDETGSISVPVYRSATYVHKTNDHDPSAFYYSRCDTPTRRALEKQVAALEHGVDAVAVTSGLAAMDAVLKLFVPGDRIIVSSDLYGGSYRLFDQIYGKYGLNFVFVDTWDLDAVKEAAKEEVKAIYLETPSNPMLRVSDIGAISEIARQKDALLIVDNTFLSPLYQKPIELGADIVVHSATKYLSGHHDVLAGVIVTATAELREKLYFYVYATGSPLSPDDCWLTLRGIETLSVRLQRQQENAKALSEFLKTLPNVAKVIYPGDEEHPDHKLAKRQQTGFGSMISFEVKDFSKAPSYFEKFNLIYQAGSLGGVQSLISLPNYSLQCPIPAEQRKHTGVTDGLFRLSVGIEDVEDLKEDLRQALS
jgi:cystathionine beta-lyase/cystathionine gamma-synthase